MLSKTLSGLLRGTMKHLGIETGVIGKLALLIKWFVYNGFILCIAAHVEELLATPLCKWKS